MDEKEFAEAIARLAEDYAGGWITWAEFLFELDYLGQKHGKEPIFS